MDRVVNDYKVPTKPGMMLDNRRMQQLEGATQTHLATSGSEQAYKQAQNNALMRKLSSQIRNVAPTSQVDAAWIKDTKRIVGSELDDIYKNAKPELNTSDFQAMLGIKKLYQRAHGKEHWTNRLDTHYNAIMKGAPNYQAVPVAPYPNTTPAHLLPPGNRGPNTHAIVRQNPQRGGEWYQERRMLLKNAIDDAKPGSAEQRALKDMRKALDDAAERSMPADMQGKLKLANRDYALLSDMQKHVHDAEAFVPPRLLSDKTTSANSVINDLHIWDKIRSNQHASSLGASSVVGRAFQSSPRENIAAVLNSGAGTSLFDKAGLCLYNIG
jgi:hypothetical protein